jgi:hypothetical protein
MKLNHPIFFESCPDRQGTRFPIHTDDITNQEISPSIILAGLFHHHAQKEGIPEELLISRFQCGVKLLKNLRGGAAIQLLEQVLPALRHEHGNSDRAAALSHDGIHRKISREGDPRKTGMEGLAANKKDMPFGRRASTDHPPDFFAPGIGEIETF